MKSRAAPPIAVDVLRRDGQQPADGVLDGSDVAARINNLRFYVQIGRLHLVDGSAVGLSVLPKRLLCLQGSVPQAVGHGEDFQLSVEHLQHVVLLCCGRNEVGPDSVLTHLCLTEHSLGSALLIGDATKDVDIHGQL